MDNKKVILAISGGVDSAMSVKILQSLGYEVTGVNFMFWKWGSDPVAQTAIDDILDDISQKFSIKIIKQDQRDYFKQKVIGKFVEEVGHGLTPNPCVFCNPMVKFALLLDYANQYGFDHIATGHYAQITYQEESQTYHLRKAVDDLKDQSYMLCYLNQEILSRTIFPLGDKRKSDVVALGKELSLQSADADESQDLCFVKPENYHTFLSGITENSSAGKIVDSAGAVLGEHEGLFHYTIGQRKGIKVFSSKPYYVIRKDHERNELIIGHLEELDKQTFFIADPNWISEEPLFPLKTFAKIRYRSTPIECQVERNEGGKFKVMLINSTKGITPGQYAVFYEGDIVLGGGKIIR